MATIEERAEKCANEWRECYGAIEYYIEKALVEQDRIARAEERERCIKVAQDYHCNNHCKGYCTMYSACKNCNEREEIRKAMMEE